jgi:hypothetical protein
MTGRIAKSGTRPGPGGQSRGCEEDRRPAIEAFRHDHADQNDKPGDVASPRQPQFIAAVGRCRCIAALFMGNTRSERQREPALPRLLARFVAMDRTFAQLRQTLFASQKAS